MAIDESIYGDSTEWGDYFHENCKITDYWLWSKVVDMDWTLNTTLDNSICYFGAVGDFYVGNPIAFFKTNNERCLLYEPSDVHNILFLANLRELSEGWCYNAGQVAWTDNKWAEWDMATDMPDYVFQASVRALFNLKLNKLLFVPHVEVLTQIDMDEVATDYVLGDWLENHVSDHPYLTRVYLIPYYNSGTDENPSWVAATESSAHTIWTQKNAFFSEDFYNRGDANVTLSYSIGGDRANYNQFVVMGFGKNSLKQYIDDSPGMRYNPIGFDPDVSHYVLNESNNYARYIRPFSADLILEIYKQISFYGFFFLGSGDDDFSHVTLTNERVYLGIIEDGFTYGRWTHGEENADQPQFSWEDTSESDYDPSKTPPKPDLWSNNYPNAIDTHTRVLTNHWYAYTETHMPFVFKAINEVDLEHLDKSTTYGLNPIDGVLQLRRVYFDMQKMRQVLSPSWSTGILIGELEIQNPPVEGVSGYGMHCAQNIIYDYDCGSADLIEPKNPYDMSDFRAYTPFSSAIFYDSFCGVVEVDPAKFLNKTVKVIQTIDFLTGDKITSLWSKDFDAPNTQFVRIATVQGNCAEELPINGQAVSDYQRNKYMMSNRMIVNTIGAFGRAVMGAAGATISSKLNNSAGAFLQGVGTGVNAISDTVSILGQKHVYDHLIPSAVKVSNGASNVESALMYPPMIIMYNPKMLDTYNQTNYGMLIGFAGYKIATLDSCGVGTHVVSHPRLDIPCTASEMYIIQDQLQKGIYVKPENE